MTTLYVIPEVDRMRTFQNNIEVIAQNLDAKGKRIRELEREVERLRAYDSNPAIECSICRRVHGREITHEAE